MPKRKRCLLSAVQRFDSQNHTCMVRELEMSVDRVVTFDPRYATQFFYDCKIYGLDEAMVYLHNFVDASYHSPNDLAKDMNALSDMVNKIWEKLM